MWMFVLAIFLVLIIAIAFRMKNSGRSGENIDWELYNRIVSPSVQWLNGNKLMPFDVIGIAVWTGNPNELVISINTMESSTCLWKGYPNPQNRPFEELAVKCEENMKLLTSMFHKGRVEGTWISMPFGTYSSFTKKSIENQLREYNSQHFPETEIRINIR